MDEAPEDLKKGKKKFPECWVMIMELVAKWQVFSDLFVVSLSIHIPGCSIQKIKESTGGKVLSSERPFMSSLGLLIPDLSLKGTELL